MMLSSDNRCCWWRRCPASSVTQQKRRIVVAGLLLLLLSSACSASTTTSNDELAGLLLPQFEDEETTLSLREFEIAPAQAFAFGGWQDVPVHNMFEGIQLYESVEAAAAAFDDGQILGRNARSLTRAERVFPDADRAVELCIDQEEYGAEFCDFPGLLIQSGPFLVSINGGDAEARDRLALEAIPFLVDRAVVACEEDGPTPRWCPVI